MMKLGFVVLTLGIGLLGCEHKKSEVSKGTTGGVTTPTPTSPTPPTDMPPEAVKKDPGTPKTVPAGGGGGDVRPPVAADYATYTQDIKGSGKLTAVIEVESGGAVMGTFHCELYGDKTPMTVANFVGLATGKKPWLNPKTGNVENGTPYYDGVVFHRVIQGFMIQGGDPMGRGTGGPGYNFDDEIVPELRMGPGILAMANTGMPTTNGSQFFIVEGQPDHLNGKHTIFGKCKEMDLVTKITSAPMQGERPNPPITMKKVTIIKE